MEYPVVPKKTVEQFYPGREKQRANKTAVGDNAKQHRQRVAVSNCVPVSVKVQLQKGNW